jgi:hypothetical protein
MRLHIKQFSSATTNDQKEGNSPATWRIQKERAIIRIPIYAIPEAGYNKGLTSRQPVLVPVQVLY